MYVYVEFRINCVNSNLIIEFLQEEITGNVTLLDPSEHLRPEPVYAGKLKNEFRNYEINSEDPIKERVRRTYEQMHTNQTVEFVKCKREQEKSIAYSTYRIMYRGISRDFSSSHARMASVQQVPDDDKGCPVETQQSCGRERSGHQFAQYHSRVSDRGVHQGEAPGPRLVPSHRFNPRLGQGNVLYTRGSLSLGSKNCKNCSRL